MGLSSGGGMGHVQSEHPVRIIASESSEAVSVSDQRALTIWKYNPQVLILPNGLGVAEYYGVVWTASVCYGPTRRMGLLRVRQPLIP
eukprot:3685575-Rhodomonas_salina.1